MLTYVGWTTDVERRLIQHNTGIGARTTRGRAWVLLHIEQLPHPPAGDEPRMVPQARPQIPQASSRKTFDI